MQWFFVVYTSIFVREILVGLMKIRLSKTECTRLRLVFQTQKRKYEQILPRTKLSNSARKESSITSLVRLMDSHGNSMRYPTRPEGSPLRPPSVTVMRTRRVIMTGCHNTSHECCKFCVPLITIVHVFDLINTFLKHCR